MNCKRFVQEHKPWLDPRIEPPSLNSECNTLTPQRHAPSLGIYCNRMWLIDLIPFYYSDFGVRSKPRNISPDIKSRVQKEKGEGGGVGGGGRRSDSEWQSETLFIETRLRNRL